MKTIINILAVSIFTIALLLLVKTSKAQDNIALYFSKQPQAANSNPAFMTNTKMYVTPPLLGRLALDLHTSGFAYNDLIHKHPTYSDSLQLDFEGLLNKLKDNNNLSLSFTFDIIGGGFKIGKNYFSIGSNMNIESKIGFSKDIVDFLVHGTNISSHNADILDKQIMDATAYISTYIGYAREINEQLTVGGRIKMYTGLFNIHTNKSIVHLDFDGNEVSAYSDFDINTSFAFGHLKTISSIMTQNSNFEFEQENNTSNSISNAMNNKGIGFDMGASFKLNDKMEISASIVDIGKITWKSNPTQIKSNNPNQKISFSGVGVNYENISDNLTSYFDDMADSLKRAFDLNVKSIKSYSTAVPTKIYVGYSWEFYPRMHMQALYNGRVINGSLENSLTLNYAFLTGPLHIAIGNTFKYTWFNPSLLISLGSNFYIGTSFSSSYNLAKTSGVTTFLGFNFTIKNKI